MLAKFVFTFMTLPTYSYEDKVNVGESPLNVKSLQVPEYIRDYRVPRIIIWHFYQTSQIDVGHSGLLWQVSLICLSQIGSPLQNKGQTSTKSNVLTEIWVRGAYRNRSRSDSLKLTNLGTWSTLHTCRWLNRLENGDASAGLRIFATQLHWGRSSLQHDSALLWQTLSFEGRKVPGESGQFRGLPEV